MGATATLDSPFVPGDAVSTERRMIVAWQQPSTGTIRPVGVLSQDAHGYAFAYLEAVRDIVGFRPLVGFPDLTTRYRQRELFHLFAQRVMSPRRSDYRRYLHELGLGPEDAEPWEQLARSYGRRAVDRLQLFPVPRVVDGSVRCRFLVHGVRHVPQHPVFVEGEPRQISLEEHEATLSHLAPGTALRVVPEPENDVNPRALIVVHGEDRPIGWIPDLLVDDLHALRRVAADVSARVVQVNGPDAPPHLRVLAELRAEGADGFTFFTGPAWREITDGPAQ